MTNKYETSALEWGKSVPEWTTPISPELLGELIERMNTEHGAVAIGSTTKYTRTGIDEAGRQKVEF